MQFIKYKTLFKKEKKWKNKIKEEMPKKRKAQKKENERRRKKENKENKQKGQCYYLFFHTCASK